MKKRGLIFILSLILILGYTVFGQQGVEADYNKNAAVSGQFPSGTIAPDGGSAQKITVTPGKSVTYKVNLTNAAKVCKLWVYVLKANASQVVGTPTLLKGPRGNGGGSTANLTGSIDTSSLAAGDYRVFIEAQTDCPDISDGYGHDNDGFDCDGNPTCWSYCKVASRDKIDTSTMPYEPGNLYRTNSNPAYYDQSVVKKAGVNTCGEPAGTPTDPTLVPNSRNGECELVACDPTGKNLDNFTLTVGGATTPATGGTTTNPATGGTTTNPATGGIPATGNVVFPATTAGGAVTVNSNAVALSNTTVLDVTKGLSNVVAANNSININGATKSLKNYTGGAITIARDISSVQIGGVAVSPGNGTLMVTSAPVVITNKDLTAASVTVSIPANTTVFGETVNGTNWNGQIAPPVQLTSLDAAGPAGFKLTDKLGISVGSPTNPLLFDSPVTITITGQPGPFGFREPGGTWQNVVQCDGNNFATPTPPKFATECFVTNGTDSKIVTWHMSDFATLDLNSSVNFIASAGGICYNRDNPSDVSMSVEWGANFGYSCYQVARTECSSATNCNGVEQLRTNQFFPAFVDPAMSFNDPTVTAGKYYKYRVWGYRTPTNVVGPVNCATLNQTLGNNPASYDAKGWSLPLVVKASCEGQGTGINLQEYHVVPQQ